MPVKLITKENPTITPELILTDLVKEALKGLEENETISHALILLETNNNIHWVHPTTIKPPYIYYIGLLHTISNLMYMSFMSEE